MVISPSAYSVGETSVGHTYQAVTGIFTTSLVHLGTGQVMSPHWPGPVFHQMLSSTIFWTEASGSSSLWDSLRHLQPQSPWTSTGAADDEASGSASLWDSLRHLQPQSPWTSTGAAGDEAAWWWSCLMRDQPSLTPSLSRPVTFLGRKMQTHAYKVYIFQSYDKSTINTVHF